jgi:hypothetical protein
VWSWGSRAHTVLRVLLLQRANPPRLLTKWQTRCPLLQRDPRMYRWLWYGLHVPSHTPDDRSSHGLRTCRCHRLSQQWPEREVTTQLAATLKELDNSTSTCTRTPTSTPNERNRLTGWLDWRSSRHRFLSFSRFNSADAFCSTSMRTSRGLRARLEMRGQAAPTRPL